MLTLSQSLGSNRTNSSFWIKLSKINLKRYLPDLLDHSHSYINQFGNHSLIFTQERVYNLEQMARDSTLFIGWNSGSSTSVQHFKTNNETFLHGKYYELLTEEKYSRPIFSGISEFDSRTESTTSWDCPDALQFQIRRHANEGTETESCEDRNSNSNQYQLVQSIIGDNWNINTQAGCISPKRSGRIRCYDSKVKIVQYDDDCVVNHITRHCPHYLSICVR